MVATLSYVAAAVFGGVVIYVVIREIRKQQEVLGEVAAKLGAERSSGNESIYVLDGTRTVYFGIAEVPMTEAVSNVTSNLGEAVPAAILLKGDRLQSRTMASEIMDQIVVHVECENPSLVSYLARDGEVVGSENVGSRLRSILKAFPVGSLQELAIDEGVSFRMDYRARRSFDADWLIERIDQCVEVAEAVENFV